MVAVWASALFASTGYFLLIRRGDEDALRPYGWLWALVTAILSASMCATLWHPGQWSCVLIVCLCPLLVALTVIDLAEHRLPDRMTGALAIMTVTGLGLASLAEPHDLSLRRALIGAAALGLSYLGLALLGGGSGMGLGDVKLAPSLGALTAWFSWDTWGAGAALAFLLGGLWGGALLLRGHGLKARMPFGPFMVAGTVIALISA